MRVLVIGPIRASGQLGGLHFALRDVAEQLAARGWDVECVDPDAAAAEAAEPAAGFAGMRPLDFETWLSSRGHLGFLRRPWDLLPGTLRRLFSSLAMPRPFVHGLMRNLELLEEGLADARRHDVVLLCPDGAAPGSAALAHALHPCVAVLSLRALAQELGDRWWWGWRRRLGRACARGAWHRYAFRPVEARELGLAMLLSSRWRDEAIRAGVAPDVAHTVYVGVRTPPALPPRAGAGTRLLWVGRLAHVKGLHLLLEALPALRRVLPGVTLTVIAAPGAQRYRDRVTALVRENGLSGCVELRGAVERAALHDAYARHDALFFHSVFPEPVALVLMEAYAAGLPVVASRAGPESELVEDGVTCVCYRPGDAASVVAAVLRLVNDPALRARLAENAFRLVAERYSLEAMGRRCDDLLRSFVASRPRAT